MICEDSIWVYLCNLEKHSSLHLREHALGLHPDRDMAGFAGLRIERRRARHEHRVVGRITGATANLLQCWRKGEIGSTWITSRLICHLPIFKGDDSIVPDHTNTLRNRSKCDLPDRVVGTLEMGS